MRESMIRATMAWIALYGIVLAGCSEVAIRTVDQQVNGLIRGVDIKVPDELLQTQADANNMALDFYRVHEWPYHGNTTPAVCLAVSGGGIRSAAFSIGVMKGLRQLEDEHDSTKQIQYLRQVNIISGVSGGAYAMSWYYMNQLRDDDSEEEMFGESGQAYLRDHADFLTGTFYVTGALSSLLLTPANLFFNGLFGWHLNTSGIE